MPDWVEARIWTEMPLVSGHQVREFGIAFLDAKTGWVGAMPKGLYISDGGLTWKPIEMGNAVNKIRPVETERGHVGFAIGINVHRLEIPVHQNSSYSCDPFAICQWA